MYAQCMLRQWHNSTINTCVIVYTEFLGMPKLWVHVLNWTQMMGTCSIIDWSTWPTISRRSTPSRQSRSLFFIFQTWPWRRHALLCKSDWPHQNLVYRNQNWICFTRLHFCVGWSFIEGRGGEETGYCVHVAYKDKKKTMELLRKLSVIVRGCIYGNGNSSPVNTIAYNACQVISFT